MRYKEVLDVNNGRILVEMMGKGYKCVRKYKCYDRTYFVYKNTEDMVLIEVMDNHIVTATRLY